MVSHLDQWFAECMGSLGPAEFGRLRFSEISFVSTSLGRRDDLTILNLQVHLDQGARRMIGMPRAGNEIDFAVIAKWDEPDKSISLVMKIGQTVEHDLMVRYLQDLACIRTAIESRSSRILIVPNQNGLSAQIMTCTLVSSIGLENAFFREVHRSHLRRKLRHLMIESLDDYRVFADIHRRFYELPSSLPH